ncbi:hypothetical protein G7Y89_g5870 [Cudoniella acicularis]|uniref:Aminotransferase class I/classII large domain-containing protein n=1 Tax=Cudoniella acicularis TaxID=354080 RepID=A0A8H4RLL3_9HELO|nr:hypothetical protein G7Y89_g5870 [Cudoniella acicularis]
MIDLRVCTLSKAVGGGIEGFTCGSSARSESAISEHFNNRLQNRQAGEEERICTSTIVQTFLILNQLLKIGKDLRRLYHVACFCRRELERCGIFVYGDVSAPVLPIHTGRLSYAAKFSAVLRRKGILATPVSIPAVEFWASRVRVMLPSDFSDGQVDRLLRRVVEAAGEMGLIQKSCTNKGKMIPYIYGDGEVSLREDEQEEEERAAEEKIRKLIVLDSTQKSTTTNNNNNN